MTKYILILVFFLLIMLVLFCYSAWIDFYIQFENINANRLDV